MFSFHAPALSRPPGGRSITQAGKQSSGRMAVAHEAQLAQVGQIAFTAAFRHRQNVIGVPQAPSGFAPHCFELTA